MFISLNNHDFKFLTHPLIPAHGSFIGSIRLEPHTPKQLLVDQSIHFGASSRTYTLRERPQGTQVYSIQGENKQLKELLGS